MGWEFGKIFLQIIDIFLLRTTKVSILVLFESALINGLNYFEVNLNFSFFYKF